MTPSARAARQMPLIRGRRPLTRRPCFRPDLFGLWCISLATRDKIQRKAEGSYPAVRIIAEATMFKGINPESHHHHTPLHGNPWKSRPRSKQGPDRKTITAPARDRCRAPFPCLALPCHASSGEVCVTPHGERGNCIPKEQFHLVGTPRPELLYPNQTARMGSRNMANGSHV